MSIIIDFFMIKLYFCYLNNMKYFTGMRNIKLYFFKIAYNFSKI